MRYIVRANPLIVRAAPSRAAAEIARLQAGAIIDATEWVAGDELITGYDDPASPQPARRSRWWLRLRPRGYVALAWCDPVRNADGYPV